MKQRYVEQHANARRALHLICSVCHGHVCMQSSQEAELRAEFSATLDDLLARSDYVVLLVPVTPETTGMIGAEQLATMKKSAFLINIGRGKLLDHDALYDALVAHTIAGAALDGAWPTSVLASAVVLC